MPLASGDKLGPYEILSPIGAGGMGEVYRARDTRLGRDVAIKVAQEKFNDRFEREAKSIAALNHPNICQLYDVGPNYLVMELIEGKPLSGPLPLATALEYSRQIADALQAAHDRGIVHRDLKPANIMITSGVVKVLDFGLAKTAAVPDSDPEISPTMTLSPTLAGMILGTAAYMAPEQARGKSVDKRADVWAFGVVLYEMLTGKRLFEGETVSDILAGVLRQEPDLTHVPHQVRRLLRGCLQKDPRHRLRDIGDAMLLVDSEDSPARISAGRGWIWPAIAAALAIALGIAIVTLRQPPPLDPASIRFQIPPPEGTQFSTQMALSPDGRSLAFTASSATGGNSIWVRPLDALQSRPLPAHTSQPFFWSADSRFIAYNEESKLTKIDVSGGPPQVLCDAPFGVIGGFWTKDGTIVFGQDPGTLMSITASGGIPRPVGDGDNSHDGRDRKDVLPFLLPDGRHFIYFGVAADTVFLASLGAPRSSDKSLLDSPVGAAYAPSQDSSPGHVLFLRENTLVAQPFDTGKLTLLGTAVPIAQGVGTSLAHGYFSVSNNGVLAYRTGSGGGARVSWFDRTGKRTGSEDLAGDYRALALSPDGTRLATSHVESRNLDIWLLDLGRNTNTRLTSDPGGDVAPAWSRDGRRVAWASGSGGPRSLLVTSADGDSKPETIVPPTNALSPWDWSPDGSTLLYSAVEGRQHLWTITVDGERKARQITDTQFNETQAQFSPDGHWISYTSDESGRSEIYVRPFPASPQKGGKIKVSEGGGFSARWRRDGRELFYIAADAKMMAVDVAASGEFKAGVPHPLFQTRTRAGPGAFLWDVSADGKRFVMGVLENEQSDVITVVTNWQSGLKK